MKNGQLLRAAADAGYDVLITADRNLEFQQNVAQLPIAVIVLVVRRTRVQSIEPLLPELLTALDALVPRTLRTIGMDGSH